MSSRSIFEDLEERYAITNNDKRGQLAMDRFI